MDAAAFRQRFEPCLQAFFKQKQQTFAAFTSDPVLLEWLHEGNRLVSAGGKRVRPFLLTLGYLFAGGKDEEAILQASLSLELFHLFALVHDDIMDGGQERHGVPTSHVRIAQRLHELKRRGNVEATASSQAILIGDLLFSWSVEVLSRSTAFDSAALAAAMRVFFHMSDEVMIGQMLDIDLTTRTASSVAEVSKKMLLKTAGYTFTRPLQIGIALAGGSFECEAFAEVFGSSLGTAFQIQDDLLDVFGTLEETGKTPLSDIRDHQHSLLTQWVMDHGTNEDRQTFMAIWGNTAVSEEAIETIRSLFLRTGALTASINACREKIETAQTALSVMPMPDQMRALFQDVFTRIIKTAWLQALEERIKQPYAAR